MGQVQHDIQDLSVGDTFVIGDLLTTLSLSNFLANSDIMRLARDSMKDAQSTDKTHAVSCVVMCHLSPQAGTTSPRYSVMSDLGSLITVSEIELSIAGAKRVLQN
jgi:hypothetical protein